jgi:hypothetical protein
MFVENFVNVTLGEEAVRTIVGAVGIHYVLSVWGIKVRFSIVLGEHLAQTPVHGAKHRRMGHGLYQQRLAGGQSQQNAGSQKHEEHNGNKYV